MEKAIKRAYVFYTKCVDCNKRISVYHTLPDFGDPSYIKKCRFCDTLYWYTPEDEFYVKCYNEQIMSKACAVCNAKLSDALVNTHTSLRCCNAAFSLDDNFADSVDLDNEVTEDIEVYLLY